MTLFKNYNINQRGTDTKYSIIPIECEKYPSTLLLQHSNSLDGLIKSYSVNLFNMVPYNKCTVLKSIYAQWPYQKLVSGKKGQIPLYNY